MSGGGGGSASIQRRGRGRWWRRRHLWHSDLTKLFLDPVAAAVAAMTPLYRRDRRQWRRHHLYCGQHRERHGQDRQRRKRRGNSADNFLYAGSSGGGAGGSILIQAQSTSLWDGPGHSRGRVHSQHTMAKAVEAVPAEWAESALKRTQRRAPRPRPTPAQATPSGTRGDLGGG